jgi:hypothetical protein
MRANPPQFTTLSAPATRDCFVPVRSPLLTSRVFVRKAIDRINPFGEVYAILAKTMSEESLKQVAAAIAAKRTTLTLEEA